MNWLFVTQGNKQAFQQWKKKKNNQERDNSQSDDQEIKLKEDCTKECTNEQLPITFASDILNYEMELETDDFNLNTIHHLLSLYRIGTEYYENQHSEKYLIFKNKAQNLLSLKKVQVLLQKKQEEQMKENNSNNILQNKSSKNDEVNMQNSEQKPMNLEVKVKLNSIMKQQQQLQAMINHDFEQQAQTLQDRLNKRKQIKKDQK